MLGDATTVRALHLLLFYSLVSRGNALHALWPDEGRLARLSIYADGPQALLMRAYFP